jgi:phosphoglycolate phosphatase
VTAHYSTVIFDLDGTLVDSAPFCATILTDMLRDRGSSRTVSALEARGHLTRGATQLVGALLGTDGEGTALEVAEFRRRYVERQTPSDCLFEGVASGIELLSSAGTRMAICSNKPQHLCEKIIADFGWTDRFVAVIGSAPDIPLKPAPELAHRAFAALGGPPEACLYVGDSDVDRQTALHAGLTFALVTYGYAEPGVAIEAMARFDRFDQLVDFLSKSAEARS